MSDDDRRPKAAKDEDTAAVGNKTAGSECPVLVAAIGASAGGLKSLKKLFAGMPPGHGVAFVLIPEHEALHGDAAGKELPGQTALAVVEATDGMPVLADRIHIIPPGKFLNIAGCRLTFQDPLYCNGLRMPIDHFFCSLAVALGRRGCGILLSGTGSDGTLGLSEIKSAGGRTLAEDPDGAEFPEMPQNAIDAGVVDMVLPADAMAEAIAALAERASADIRRTPVETLESDVNLRTILDILRTKSGHDFRCYKPNTMVRRIRRRMTLAKIATYADYVRFLDDHPEEVRILQKDLLIGVTEFFRQPQAWEILEEKVIPGLIERTRPGSEIRVWVPGCSTGKEAYSLAMLLVEQIEKSGKGVSIQIFATDSDVRALATARSGSYSEEDLGPNVSPERRTRFFAFRDGLYQIIKEVRERIVFAPQNLTTDPPFSRLDLISCRNLLIYLDPQVQQKIIALFHFALHEGGALFLGTAETVGEREDLFDAVSKKWRIYRRIGVGRRVEVEIPVRPTGEPWPAPGRYTVTSSTPKLSLASAAQQMLLDRFAPACVMINRKLQVLYVHGAVEDYLTFPPGELTTRVVDMAREGLRTRLGGAIGKCLEENRPVSVTARVRRKEKSLPVKATVSLLRHPREADGLLLITFEDYRVPADRSNRQPSKGSDIQQLQDELKVTREELQSTIEQLERFNDQLKASNEEVTASNEELQAANEELETSKEEFQSLNEELNTTNMRLREKVDELESANNDIFNLLSSTNIATMFLDKELKIKRYTPAITRILGLIPSDIGRPVAELLRRFNDEALLEDARKVLADLTTLSKEVPTEDGRCYIRRIAPYRTQEDRIEGVVVTFVDVTDLKDTERALRRSKEEWEQTFNTVPDLVAILDNQHRIVRVNRAMADRLGLPFDECIGLRCYEAIHGAREAPAFCPHVLTCRDGREHVAEVHEPRLGGDFTVSTTPMFDEQGHLIGVVHVARDITERKRAEEALRESEQRVRRKLDSVLSPEGDLGGLELADIIDAPAIQSLMENFYKLAHIPMSIVDLKGKLVVGVGWQDICTRFHRAHPETRKHCVESDSQLSAGIPRGESRLYKCKNNMWDIATPVIVGGQHIGNVFSGQFFFDDETPDYDLFRSQARQYGFNEEEYIAAMEAVPRLSRESVETGMAFLTKLSDMLSQLSYGTIKLARLLVQRDNLLASLRESEALFRLLSETASRLLASRNPQGLVTELCREVMNLLDCHIFFNFLADEHAGRLHLNAWAGIPEEEAEKIEWLDYGAAVCGCSARDGKRIVVEDILATRDPRADLVKSYGVQAYVAHPLMSQGRIMGTLSFGTKTRSRFSPQDLALMKTVTDQVATALERMHLIGELQTSRDELEVRVQERTTELSRSNEALERSNRDLEDFAHVASHDLQEPLRKIQTFADRLAISHQEGLDDKARDYLQRMQRAAGRMQALVLDLLKYSHITSRPEPYTRFSLREVVEEAVADLKVLREETQGEVEVGELPDIVADRVQIRQLFQNLIANGLKYHAEAKPIIRIYTPSPTSGPFWEICAQDNGIGFDEAYLGRIFKPFQRLHGASAPYQGTGMGLAICRKIVERHGGSITAESVPGKGSTFIVKLPRGPFIMEKIL